MQSLQMEKIKEVSTWLNYARFVIQKIVIQLLFLVVTISLVSPVLRDVMIVLFVVHLMKIS